MRPCPHPVVVALPVVVLLALPVPAPSQAEKKLSAREIFYSAPKVAAKRQEPPEPAPAVKKEPVQAKKTPPKTEPQKELAKSPTSSRKPVAKPEPEQPAYQAEPETPQFVAAVETTQESLSPLGIRCSVLKRTGPTDVIEVDPDMAFRSGDRIRLRVEVNDTGYLYIVHRGSSGVWKPLFPSPEISEGNNFVQPRYSYDIPPGYVFTFDERPGQEKLFVVFSRQPEADLEGLIYDLSQGKGEMPKAAPETSAKSKVLLAQNLVDIRDDVVERLRNAYARDLIIEKVDETTPGPEKETAVYAVAASTAADSRVVVDLNLNHR